MSKTWDDFLQIACFAIRTNTKTATNRSPAELLFGFKLRTSVNSLNNTPELEELASIRERIFEETQNQMKKYIKKYSNENRKTVEIKQGDQVLVCKPHLLKSLESKFQGPFIVKRRTGNAYEVVDENGSNPFKSTINIERLKRFY